MPVLDERVTEPRPWCYQWRSSDLALAWRQLRRPEERGEKADRGHAD